MGENTAIEWADHTLNWWTGCEHVSPACDGCYAEAWAKRAGRDFAERKLTSQAIRNLPFRWQGDYAWRAQHGRPARVFVNSLSDFFDNKVPQEWRDSFFRVTRKTPNVIYMLLTKRIGNAVKMLPEDWGEGYPNIWIGSTVVTQDEAVRDIPKLLRTPARIHFLSIEPMLGPIHLRVLEEARYVSGARITLDALTGAWCGESPPATFAEQCERMRKGAADIPGPLPEILPPIDWVIAGGESGGQARPVDIRWIRQLRDDCAAAFVPFFFKQWGEWGPNCEPPVRDSYRWPIEQDEEGGVWSYRIGKKRAGALLDGREHKAWPAP